MQRSNPLAPAPGALTPEQLEVVGKLSDSELAILRTVDLDQVAETRRDMRLKALFRGYYPRRERTTRARHIERDIKLVRQGKTTGQANKDQVLGRLATLCGDRVPCANTILRVCKDVRIV